MDKLILHIDGQRRAVSLEVLLKQVGNALRGMDIGAGVHELLFERDGSVTLDGMVIFTPPKPQIAKRR